ncbi:DNA topoisomerase III [Aestuariicella hydrocarbonica]|uniref:DNA topoisomerase n=1 Tax=Pseudomaricurvus hydrocarbonicus TaxID=1470433 RepID=A0A9E5JTI3_9GAMM|nr:DNA topoisomerase III [Aestuariicella hydrocarbonica]NHO64570.1 DNA topoisomerase III [Aestuariicella hydrocarbonica]
MILYIAEKPSLGRAIASAIPGSHKNAEGHIQLATGDVVSWCIGHLLEQAEPDAYDPKYKKWSHDTLPIVPQEWKLIPKPKTRKQLTVLRQLIKQADQLVHAGDPDREGQLLVDQVIDYLGASAAKKQQAQRCLINDLNRPAVQQALSQLRSNQDFVPLSTSALARSRADWLYGLNMTRAYTLQGKQAGYQGVLSVGRVQTPVLGLVVRRDHEIAQFVPHDYYDVWAHLWTSAGAKGSDKEGFKAKWVPSDSCADFLDEQGRNRSKPLADNVATRITGQPAEVVSYKRQQKQRPAPLPHSLSSLQIDANKAFGLSAQQVLDCCQALYEKHKLITYPRSDSRYLPQAHFAQGQAVAQTAVSNMETLQQPQFREAMTQAVFTRKSRAWNDKKVDAHHAIIPTQKQLTRLSEAEAKVYQLVCRNYLAQFLLPESYAEVRTEIRILTGLFVARAKQITEPGWTCLFPKKNQPVSPEAEDEVTVASLPVLAVGDRLHCERGEVVTKQTTPPKPFTDATLLSAMTGIGRFVSDPQLRKILKDTDGLGTEATRAGIIELLFKRGFLVRKGKAIHSTPAGQGLIAALPDSATWPDMTARWESELESISQRETKYSQFMTPMVDSLYGLLEQAKTSSFHSLKGLGDGKSQWKKSQSNKSQWKKPGRRRSGKSGSKTTAKT